VVLRKIFGHKRDKLTGEWERQLREGLYDLYAPNVIWLIK
jgi:hypothetical protein